MKNEMESAKMHYDALMASLNKLGMSLEDFQDKMEGEGEEEEGGMEKEGGMEEEGGMGKAHGKPMDRAKIAVIVAKMKNKMKE